MPVTFKFIVFQSIIAGGFLSGYLLKRFSKDNAGLTVKKILRLNIIIFEPLIIMNSTWGIEISSQLLILPAAGLFIVLVGFFSGSVISGFIFRDKISRATFIIASSLANHGFTMGAFICYILIGNAGLSLSFIFTIYFTFYVFIFIFNYASSVRYSHRVNLKFILKNLVQLQNMPLYAITAALVLTLSGVKRPFPVFKLDMLIYAVVFLYFPSLGMQFTFTHISKVLKPSFYLAMLKFIAVPALVFVLMSFVSVSSDIRAVIIIQSFMPTGVFSVVTASLYDLDRELASALFVLNTAIYAAAVLPLSVVFLQMML